MKSLSPSYLSALQFSSKQVSTLRTIGECQGRQDLFTRQTPETLEALRQAVIIESSECSNRLEGITAPHHRIEALVTKYSAPRNRSEQEIAGYRDALALIHESARYMDFNVNVILQLHAMIHRYLPQQGGRWKMTDNEIVERDASGQITRGRRIPNTARKDDGGTEFRDARLAAIENQQSEITNPLTVSWPIDNGLQIVTKTFYPPFTKVDREEDYRRAWAVFKERNNAT
jgi:hypothetical protein